MHFTTFDPFISIGKSFKQIGLNMAFQGSGDVFGEIPTISSTGNWGFVVVAILLMMNLITFIFNLIPFPPLDG
jgi:Zn-dependent protease